MDSVIQFFEYTSAIHWSLFFLPIFDLLKAASWPLVALLLGMIYRSDIKELLGRAESISRDAIKLTPRSQDKAKPADVLDYKINESTNPNRPKTLATIAALEERLMAQIPSIDPENRTNIIIRDLAIAKVVAAFETTYRIIFGSQIRFLKELSEGKKFKLKEAQSYFEGAQLSNYDNYPEGYEGWLKFLVTSDLVAILDGSIEITQLGQDFLHYMKTFGLIEEKPL